MARRWWGWLRSIALRWLRDHEPLTLMCPFCKWPVKQATCKCGQWRRAQLSDYDRPPQQRTQEGGQG